VTKNVQAQLKAVANEAAVPRILAEIITWIDLLDYCIHIDLIIKWRWVDVEERHFSKHLIKI